MINNSDVNLLNGFFKDNVLSKSGNCYKITCPVEINMGNWACRGKIYNKKGKLIYYKATTWLHDISSNVDQLSFIKWSMDGTHCAFYEYEHGERYELVLISCDEEVEYRIDLVDIKFDFKLLENFLIIDLITKYRFSQNRLSIPDLEQKRWFSKEKWYPI